MGFRKEYLETRVFTVDDLFKYQDYVKKFRMYGTGNIPGNELASALGSVGTILGLVTLAPLSPTAAAVAGAIMSVYGAIAPNEKGQINTALQKGEDALWNIYANFRNNPTWEAVEIEMLILEFTDEKVKACQNYAVTKGIRRGGTWYY